MLYVLTLRPLFFLQGNPSSRISTVIHEMFHFSEAFDGTLHPKRRHSVLGSTFHQHLSPLVERYLDEVPNALWRGMAQNGTVRVRMWLEKPGLSSKRTGPNGTLLLHGRQVYTERHTFLTTFKMKTPKEARRRPPRRASSPD